MKTIVTIEIEIGRCITEREYDSVTTTIRHYLKDGILPDIRCDLFVEGKSPEVERRDILVRTVEDHE